MGKERAFAALGPMLVLGGCLAAAAAGLSDLGVLTDFGADAARTVESLAAQAFPGAGR
jgi:hypothetical protein